MSSKEKAYEGHEDLDWLAFCYLAEELDVEQTESFENRLAADQEVREALARAVELSETVVALRPLPTPAPAKPPTKLLRPLSWMTLGAGICLCVMLVVQAITSNAGKDDRMTAETEEQINQSSLAVAWDELRLQFDSDETDPLWSDPDAVAAEEPDSFEEQLVMDDEESLQPPAWMESALLGMATDETDEDEEWEG